MAEVVAGTESEDNMSMSMSLQDLLGSHSHGGRRVKRKSVVEEPLVVDKVTLQKQRRMIKNRESAARSRERKQAYTVELESLVTHLEEENAVLLQLAADRKRLRLNQLMECLIPVEEKRKPKRMLRRVNSSQWISLGVTLLYREIMQLNNSTNLIQAEAYYWFTRWRIPELMDIAGIGGNYV
ncbi:G-box-binding factor 4 [Glycine soja]|nr:G-box-binding factor 4 [Glycine soja]